MSEGAARSVYVYGVVRDTTAAPLAAHGVGGEQAPVRKVEGAGLAAVVSDVPAGWETAGRADVEAHDRVLAELIDRETLVPMRFGIVMDSDDEVRERLLERHAERLAELLERLQGRVQMSVKAYYTDDGLLREVLARRPDFKERSQALDRLPPEVSQPDRIGLGREVAQAVEEQRAQDERTLVEPLAAVAEDVRVDAPVSERQAVAVQLLVDAERRQKLDATVRQLSSEHADRFGFRYVGPLPPYSFCDVALDQER